jgi:hypothetical protein
MRNLTLKDNSIEDVSPLVGLEQLENVDLTGNPLDCGEQRDNLERIQSVSESNDGELEHDCEL